MSRWDKPAPFLRLAGGELSEPLPEGWKTHPAGSIGASPVEVAFDPLRHDVTIVWDDALDPVAVRGIEAAGWRALTRTDTAQIWSRDRLVSRLRQRVGLSVRERYRHRGRGVAWPLRSCGWTRVSGEMLSIRSRSSSPTGDGADKLAL